MRMLVLLFASLFLIFTVRLQVSRTEAHLLRADPATLTDGDWRGFALSRGAAYYDSNCSGCHAAAGIGDTDRGAPDLTDSDWLYGSGSVAEIEQIITYGIRSDRPKSWNIALMPAYGSERPNPKAPEIKPLTPAEIDDLVEWILYAEGRQADTVRALRGADLYRGRGGCYDCHGPDLKGDSAIGAPNLADRITLYGDGTRRALAASIAAGRQGVCPGWFGRMSAAAILETAVYVHSLSEQRMDNRSRASHFD